MTTTPVSFMKILLALIFSGMMAFSLSACEGGTAEEAGEEVDEMASDVGNAIEDACEEVKEGANAENPNC